MSPLESPSAILVICLRYLGDTLLLRPPLRALRTAFPAARIDALVTSGTGVALDDCKNVSHVLEWPRRKWLQELALISRIAGSGYDWAIDFTGNDRSALIALCSGAPLRVAYDRPKLSRWSLRRCAYNFRPAHKKKKPHILMQRLELLENCGVKSQGFSSDLLPRSEALKWAEHALSDFSPPFFHIHVTSRDMQKAIPVQIVREVIEGIIKAEGSVILTGGGAEIERKHVAACLGGFPLDRVRLFENLTWHQLVALIAQCDKYWGADTAPAHIAAALEKPMLIHYGPSRTEHWRPLHAGGHGESLACSCLLNKISVCSKGQPGTCLEKVNPHVVLAWLLSGTISID